MHKTISTWEQFEQSWDGVINFLMEGECITPFSYVMPPIANIVETLRQHPATRITPGIKSDTLELTDVAETFRRLPIEEALRSQFSLAHFDLSQFYGEGQLLEAFDKQVMEPWENALRTAGYTWNRCYPILFLSGPNCATNYHMDYSHVLAWQTHGTKLFSGLKDPERWAPLEVRIPSVGVRRPQGIREEDVLAYEMKPGMILWNTLLTPHWVEAPDEASCSINIAIHGLKLNGQLCKHEQELEQWIREHPNDSIWRRRDEPPDEPEM